VLFGRIDHIGVAVDDLEAAIELYASRFDMREQHRETVESQGVEAVLLEVGEGHVELLRPLADDTAVAKFLAKRGPGLHHVAYQTDDIDRTLGVVRDALDGDDSQRWHELAAEDATILVDLSQVVFIRLDTQEQRIGFRGA